MARSRSKRRSRSRRRRNPSRGWGKSFPRKGRERNLLYKQCGSRCFLLPKNLKFPICAASRKGRSRCSISSAGTLAAYRRARQYRYPKVAARALSIAKRKGFSWYHD